MDRPDRPSRRRRLLVLGILQPYCQASSRVILPALRDKHKTFGHVPAFYGISFIVDGSIWQMNLDDICPIVDADTDLPLRDKRAVLQDVAHRAALALNVEDNVVFDAVLKREELGSTGVGNGVAIPHVRLEQVKKPFGILVRLREPIDFNAIDGQRVDLVCLVLLAKQNEAAQLTALAGIARRLRTPEVLQELRHAPNRVVLYNVMVGRPGQSR
jgi:nitrogen PTS system EIIA component